MIRTKCMRQVARAIRAVIATACVVLGGCATGPMLHQPEPTAAEVADARAALARHDLKPSLLMPWQGMQARLDRIWRELRPAVVRMCSKVFDRGMCGAVYEMRVVVVPRNDINAYADSRTYTIGVHAGLMHSAGDDDEIAYVLGHEAAHLLLGHTEKKLENAHKSGLLAAMVLGALGGAAAGPGMSTDYARDLSQRGMELGMAVGYRAYNPEMELEADQFALFVQKESGRRLSAGADTIVRLHRGAVPSSVRAGEGWASYLDTHPADDRRLAAMQATLRRIKAGADRPISQEEYKMRRQAEQQARVTVQKQGVLTWPDGTHYEGGVRNGEPHGNGVLTWPDGQRYEGGFRNGRPHGNGVLTWPDGQRYEGEWVNDEFRGGET